MHDKAADDHRSDLVEAVFERRDHAEVAATAAERPEQVAVFMATGVNESAIGKHDVGTEQVVDGHPELAFEPSKAAAKRQAGDARVANRAARGRQSERLRLPIELGPAQSRFRAHGLCHRIDSHPFHVREINHHSVVAHASSGDIVATSTNGYRQALGTRELHAGDHICGAARPRNHGGSAVDHGVPDAPGLVVACVLRGDQVSTMSLTQIVQRVGANRHNVPPDMVDCGTSHSARSATTGSTRAARQAGIQQAVKATTTRTATTPR